MGKIRLITWREYTTRVRKKSFIIMTILGPVLIALFYGVLIYLIVNEDISRDSEIIYVSDPGNHVRQNRERRGSFVQPFTNGNNCFRASSAFDHAMCNRR